MLALAQVGKRVHIRCVAYQMEAAQALHSQDLPLKQQVDGATKDRIAFFARGTPGDVAKAAVGRHLAPTYMRTALEASIGLGMESPVFGIGVLMRAFRAHRELAHGRARAIVRQLVDDREAWAAVRAVDERIAITPVGRVE